MWTFKLPEDKLDDWLAAKIWHHKILMHGPSHGFSLDMLWSEKIISFSSYTSNKFCFPWERTKKIKKIRPLAARLCSLQQGVRIFSPNLIQPEKPWPISITIPSNLPLTMRFWNIWILPSPFDLSLLHQTKRFRLQHLNHLMHTMLYLQNQKSCLYRVERVKQRYSKHRHMLYL